MLSICIPIFNFDVRMLVTDLHWQCQSLGHAWEILCFDDGSTPIFEEKNKELAYLSGVVYRRMPQNLGRSAIRNALGKAAKYEQLLFMDCDSAVVRPDFLRKYLHHAAPGRVVYGGRSYRSKAPEQPELFFHWKYGREREQTTAQQRQTNPWHGFMTNNFLIHKDLLLANPFDESLMRYGHEDTLFGLELEQKGASVLHIDNPLRHDGLETAGVFLKKTKQGLENLMLLHQRGAPIQTRILGIWQRCKKWGLIFPLRLVFPLFEPLLLRQLTSKNPSLLLFDFWKLGHLAKM